MHSKHFAGVAVLLAAAFLGSCNNGEQIAGPRQETGTLIITSEPAGARIILDNQDTKASTPDSLVLLAGTHNIRFVLAGYYDKETTAVVQAARRAPFHAILRPLGSLAVTSEPSGATIWIDDANTGRVTPTIFTGLTARVYVVKLTRAGFYDWQAAVTISNEDPTSVSAVLEAKCPGDNIVGSLAVPPEIRIVGLQPGQNRVRGTANNVDATRARVVLWAKTDIWYVQPYIAWPYTEICGDGTWENGTHPWQRLVALLVDSTYVPGSIRLEHPSSDPGVLAWDEYPFPSTERVIEFGGYAWKVKVGDLAGPGPNYFSDSTANVWLDGDGLHLKIAFRDGRWYCAEVFLDRSLGYGTYTFQLGSRTANYDYRTVGAGFTYASATNEIDIEFSKVLADPNNAQYVIQPWYHAGNINRFLMPDIELSTHRFVWQADRIEFVSWRGLMSEPNADSLLNAWTYVGADIPAPGPERMRFNLWLFQGNPPISSVGDEMVVKSFTFKP